MEARSRKENWLKKSRASKPASGLVRKLSWISLGKYWPRSHNRGVLRAQPLSSRGRGKWDFSSISRAAFGGTTNLKLTLANHFIRVISRIPFRYAFFEENNYIKIATFLILYHLCSNNSYFLKNNFMIVHFSLYSMHKSNVQ